MTPAGPPLSPYEGRTRSHAKFREKFKYANALYYLIVTGKDRLREHLAAELGKRRTELPYILGMVTHVVSQTEMALVTIHSTDAQAMIDDFDQFIATHDRQCIISAHRMGLDFALDLLEELL